MQPIPPATSYTATLVVTDAHSAAALGSGDLPVLGTPAMTALMEQAAMQAIAPFLETGTESSVGISLTVTHERATAIGNTVTATATVTHTDGRRIDFAVTARDSSGAVIGEGTHTRFIVDVQKFMARIGK